MSIIRGLPTRRSPQNTHSTQSGEKSSGWDRFNNKLTPEQKKSIREKLNEFYPDDPMIPPSKFPKTPKETPKEYLRRMWNVLYPDDQIDWDNFKPRPMTDLWNRFYLDFASEEEMYRQDHEDDPIDYGMFCPDDGLPESVYIEKVVPNKTLHLICDEVIHDFMRKYVCMDEYYEDETDEWGNKIDNEGNIIEYYDWDIGKRY